MPISGLVLTLAEDATRRQAALAALEQHPAIRVGQPAGHRLPIVVETADSQEDVQIWDWLHTLPGVVLVDVVMVHFDQPEAPPDGTGGGPVSGGAAAGPERSDRAEQAGVSTSAESHPS
jgi:nitrate reductase NapAB chaperone NapD